MMQDTAYFKAVKKAGKLPSVDTLKSLLAEKNVDTTGTHMELFTRLQHCGKSRACICTFSVACDIV